MIHEAETTGQIESNTEKTKCRHKLRRAFVLVTLFIKPDDLHRVSYFARLDVRNCNAVSIRFLG